ncbi:endonuclease/exonuclease/phosphatase family protein [Thalassobius sp. Cn5-15]|uniref:endonuclease/exonuclease/phosphatase family protein n=1 Tax=Thalassobius sp. Cn5-15 TaxID=2917763 RepID=UPI001EF2D37C|nr:endonuclease/exonuclease/phosphatase family protein [Thalassobius sp. Cn5-15]MCG7494807.1 endonuclease [Thalassobius sp. Cn5-15]
MQLVDQLRPVSQAQFQQIRTAPRTAEAHSQLMQQIEAMQDMEQGGQGTLPALPRQFTVAAWNIERGLDPVGIAAALRPHAPAVVLLSEADKGMARTHQRDVTADIAAELNMHYLYGVEFLELGLGSDQEQARSLENRNALGFHGNAVLSCTPIVRASLVRLYDGGHWFQIGPDSAGDLSQPRIGDRMAILAELATEAGPICVASLHLESNAEGPFRAVQFDRLMDAIDQFAPDLPVIIGGDLNTGNTSYPDFDWRGEELFQIAGVRGYSWAGTPDGMTTRPSLLSPKPKGAMKLDWFAHRGLTAAPVGVMPALDTHGTPLSDHDAIMCGVDMG